MSNSREIARLGTAAGPTLGTSMMVAIAGALAIGSTSLRHVTVGLALRDLIRAALSRPLARLIRRANLGGGESL